MLTVGVITHTHLVSLHIDANPEKEEQSSKAHEDRGHAGDHQLLLQLTCELGRGYLVNEEPSCKEEANAKKHQAHVGKHTWIDGWNISGQGLKSGDGHFYSLVIFKSLL